MSFLEAKQAKLITERLALRRRLAEVDGEIGRLDLLMAPKPVGDFFWQKRVNFDQTRAEQAAMQSDAKEMSRPPYENLVQ